MTKSRQCLIDYHDDVRDIGFLTNENVPYAHNDRFLSGDLLHIRRVIYHLDKILPSVYSYYITWKLDDIDLVDPNENYIVFLVGEEKQLVPSYVNRVACVLKTGGIYPNGASYYKGLPWALRFRIFLRESRNALLRYKRRNKAGQAKLDMHKMIDVPLGTHCPRPHDIVPINDREHDVFYAAKVADKSFFSLRPKKHTRSKMMHIISEYKKSHGNHRIMLSGFGSAQSELTHQEYARQLTHSKIVLCPRGNFEETYRLMESVRAGCVVICDKLPKRWYYQDHPAIEISDWRTLPKLLDRLLQEPDTLSVYQQKSLQWWENTVSEQAVAKYVGAQILALDQT